jgi:hypothetical protein
MSNSKEDGPADFWSKMMSSKFFRDKLGLAKYARWAQDLTEQQFTALLCAVGEYGYRAEKPLEILRRDAPKDDAGVARAIVGLEILAEFATGRPSTDEEQTRRIYKAAEDAQRIMFRNNVCARRWKRRDLEVFHRLLGEQALFDLLFSAFTQELPLSRAAQQTLSGYLRELRPRGRQRLTSLVRGSLRGWDGRVQQLPLYFCEVYGIQALRLAVGRLDLDTSLSVRERKALQSYKRWLRAMPEAGPLASPNGGVMKPSRSRTKQS